MSARKGRVPDPTGNAAAGRAGEPPVPVRVFVALALAECARRDDRKGAHLMRHRLVRCPA